MQVNINITCRALFEGFSGGAVEVEPGATIWQALVACCEQGGCQSIDGLREHLICMRNKRNAQFDDPVEDGDMIFILHRIMGG